MDVFELNSKVELIAEENKIASGLIYDMKDNKLYVSVISDDRDFIIFKVGQTLNGVVYLKQQILGFECVVTERIQGDLPIYELSNIRNFKKVQRRNDIRIPYTRPVLYTVNKFLLDLANSDEGADEILDRISKYLQEGLILDLSGGGMRISCESDFPTGMYLLIALSLGDEKFILKGKIVHKEINIIGKETRYSYGIKFLDLKQRIKEQIIQFIFVLMRRNRMIL